MHEQSITFDYISDLEIQDGHPTIKSHLKTEVNLCTKFHVDSADTSWGFFFIDWLVTFLTAVTSKSAIDVQKLFSVLPDYDEFTYIVTSWHFVQEVSIVCCIQEWFWYESDICCTWKLGQMVQHLTSSCPRGPNNHSEWLLGNLQYIKIPDDWTTNDYKYVYLHGYNNIIHSSCERANQW